MYNIEHRRRAVRAFAHARSHPAHTCVPPFNIIHAHARVAQCIVLYVLISCSRPRPAPLGAGCGREYVNMSSRASHVKYRFLAYNLEPVSFSTTAAYSSVFAVWGAIRFASLYKKYLLVLSTAAKMA